MAHVLYTGPSPPPYTHLWKGHDKNRKKALLGGFFRIPLKRSSDFAAMSMIDAMHGPDTGKIDQYSQKLLEHPMYPQWQKKHGSAILLGDYMHMKKDHKCPNCQKETLVGKYIVRVRSLFFLILFVPTICLALLFSIIGAMGIISNDGSNYTFVWDDFENESRIILENAEIPDTIIDEIIMTGTVGPKFQNLSPSQKDSVNKVLVDRAITSAGIDIHSSTDDFIVEIVIYIAVFIWIIVILLIFFRYKFVFECQHCFSIISKKDVV